MFVLVLIQHYTLYTRIENESHLQFDVACIVYIIDVLCRCLSIYLLQ